MSTVSAPASSSASRGSVSSTFSTPSVEMIAILRPFSGRPFMHAPPVRSPHLWCRSEQAKQRDPDDAGDHAEEQAPSPNDRRHDQCGGERLRSVRQGAPGSRDRGSDERGDDRDGQGLEIARGRGGQAATDRDRERRGANEICDRCRPGDGEPDHRRIATATRGASAPPPMTATVDAPASARAPAIAAATMATSASLRRRTPSTTIARNVAVIAKSTPKRRGSPSALPRSIPAAGAVFHSEENATPEVPPYR